MKKKGLYRTLALTGIRKNKQLYRPYILSCIGTVMMCYIILFLSTSDTIKNLKGGGPMQMVLELGFGVMAVFSCIFLFYTSSFLTRRRKKEFGLYNILGLGKRHISAVLFLETLILAGITIVCGLAAGILFSKMAELCVIKIIGGSITFTYSVSVASIIKTAALFLGIYALVFINTLRQIHLTNPIELLHSENTGEKPPKANKLIAILGIVILAVAYWLAVTIENPSMAFNIFFIAVILVIAATYILFISGSVTMCKSLQKNKNYYYKTNHFISVSSMAYRMKRNGAGLASICILSTMVLVMISTTVSLYIGTEDSLKNMYIRDININAYGMELFQSDEVDDAIGELDIQKDNVIEYDKITALCNVNDGKFEFYNENDLNGELATVCKVCIMSLDDYNKIMETNEKTAQNEVMIYTGNGFTYDKDTIELPGTGEMKISDKAANFENSNESTIETIPVLYVVTNDFDRIADTLGSDPAKNYLIFNRYYGFDMSVSDDEQIAFAEHPGISLNDQDIEVVVKSRAQARSDFYGLYGGMLMLGILLGIVFIFATVLIIYYKQVSEGYEDRSKFDIMQKVGMTKAEIKKSINSQILTVFFMPLATAAVHLIFAFPMITRILKMLNLTNVSLLTVTTICCFAVFMLFYMAVYKITSNSYYSIVKGA